MARKYTNTYQPRTARKGQRLVYLHSDTFGTGGTAVTASATTTIPIESPYVRGWVEGLAIRGDTAAVSGAGTVLVTVYKWDVANAAAVALNTAFSIESDGLTALKANLPITVLSTLTTAQRTKLEADTLYAEIVSNSAIGTAPVRVQVSVALAQTR